MASVVLITGVSRLIGGQAAAALARSPGIERVLAVDSVPPAHSIGGAQFVRADIRNPMIGKIIAQEKVDTVVHAGVITTPRHVGGRASQKDINVIGTMQLLAACQRAESLERLVVKSSSSIYGSSPRDPAMFTEDMAAKRAPGVAFGKDSLEVETYVRGFARRRPDVTITSLRMANVVGHQLRTPLSDYFSSRLMPVPLGFDGRIQVLHMADAVGALLRAVLHSPGGTVNVAGDGVLTVRQAARLLGRPTVPVLTFTGGLVGAMFERSGLGSFDASQMDWLAYGRVMDTARMRADLGYEPEFSTREALLDVFGDDHVFPPSVGSMLDSVLGSEQ